MFQISTRVEENIERTIVEKGRIKIQAITLKVASISNFIFIRYTIFSVRKLSKMYVYIVIKLNKHFPLPKNKQNMFLVISIHIIAPE